MRILQVVPNLHYGDAVGNDIITMDGILKEAGFRTGIYAHQIDKRIFLDSVHSFSSLEIKSDDVLILHEATAHGMNEWVKGQKCRKIMVYHNITPPHFFAPYDTAISDACTLGLGQVEGLKESFGMVLADSSFNRQNLIDIGYETDIKVLPILISFSDYDKTPDGQILSKYSDDGFTNILFVGRVAPNKCQQDVIAAFDAYQRNCNPKSRLFIVGSPCPEYYKNVLEEYVRQLGTNNVIFTGHTRFDEILAYYHLCDLFLCQSEHEGFCVPLVEAMYFHKPIVAYDSSAIGETLGGGGFLLKEKNPMETAAVMNRILTDDKLQQAIVSNQDERLEYFSYERIRDLFLKYMDEFMERAGIK